MLPKAGLLLLAALAGCTSRQPVSPRFTYTADGFRELAATLPPDVSARASAEPARFLDLLARALDSPPGVLQLVDKSRGLDRSWAPPDLADLAGNGLALGKRGLRLRAVALADLVAMSSAASADGVVVPVSSAFRSWDEQQALRSSALAAQPREQVDRELAPAGHSQHQLGTAVDLGSIDDTFAATPAGRWMETNAWRYGWSLSYPRDGETATGYRWESWHYRWIGRAGAELVHVFFGGSQQAFLSFWAGAEHGLRAKRTPGS